MGLFDYLKETKITESVVPVAAAPEVLPEIEEKPQTDADYFDIKNPETGFRYNIPMLDTGAPGYYYKYINYMKIRETSPETFKQIMDWK